MGTHRELSDFRALSRGCMMTQEGFGQAYQKGFIRTVKILCSRGASVHNAEDLAQAAWLRGWRKLDQLRDERMIASWVMAIAINYHRQDIRAEARFQDLPDLCGNGGIDSAVIDTDRILKSCPAADRLLFEQQLGGLTTQEIAAKQGASVTAIRIRLFRARRAARARMEQRESELRDSLRVQDRVATAA